MIFHKHTLMRQMIIDNKAFHKNYKNLIFINLFDLGWNEQKIWKEFVQTHKSWVFLPR